MMQVIENVVERASEERRGFFRPARVLETEGSDLCRVLLDREGQTREAWAMLALPGGHVPAVNDRVLVAGDGPEGCYVVGLMGGARGGARPDAPSQQRLACSEGACAVLARRDGEEAIEVRDTNDRVIFEYRPGSGKALLTMPSGDLAIQAPEGNIELNSGKHIICRGAGEVSLEAQKAIRLSTPETEGQAATRVELTRGTPGLGGAALEVFARRGDFRIGEASYKGQRFDATLECVKVVANRLETVARRIVEKAKDVYRLVDNLNQVKAGRMRTLVDGAYHVKAGRAALKSDDDMRIDGKRIYLG